MQYRIVNDIGYLLGAEYKAYSIESVRGLISYGCLYI